MKRRWNWVLLTLIVLTTFCVLTGCSNTPKNEKGIIEDLKASDQFISSTAEITSCEIIKRKTDTENHTDEVYVTVKGKNDVVSFTLSYMLTYELYNEGWFLEGISQYPDGPFDIQGLPEEQLKEDVINNDPFLSSHTEDVWNFSIEDYTINSENCYFDSSPYSTSYVKTYDLTIEAYNTAMYYTATCTAEYVVLDDEWICRYYNTNNAFSSPNFSPSEEAFSKIMTEKGYTRYELGHIDTDWEHNKETQYYRAYRDFELGSEEYEIVIPLTFEVESEDYSWGWNYSSNQIIENLVSVDWSLKGTWSAVNDNFVAANQELPRYSLSLYIGDMMEDLTYNDDDESGFGFFATCESVYIYRNNLQSIYRSYTEGPSVGMIEIDKWEPGVYVVNIGDLTGDYEIHMGSKDDDIDSGVYWTGGGQVVKLSKQEG